MSNEQRRLAGRYVLGSPIGRGGMGEVWRATDTVLHREVAVKTIDLRSVPDESGAARFDREARATAGINHPGIVTVHDSGVEDDTAFLVMELLPGPSLAERLREGPLPVEEVVSVGEQVARALDAAHARGLVHRDIKPGNIAYADDGRIRVLDFGITQLGEAAAGNQALTATHTVMGTAEYLAPEQALGGRVDGRADLYALGCVLFALLAGKPPFSGPTPVATMMMHANDPVPDVRTLRPETPGWLADVVTSLLAKDPADRPTGAAAVAAALADREAVAGAATSVLPAAGAAAAATGAAATQRLDPVPPPPPPSAPYPGRYDEEDDRRGGSAVTWVLALVALAAVAALFWLLFLREEPSTPTNTPSTRPTASAPATTTPPSETPAPAPTETPTPTPSDTADLGGDVEDALGALSDGIDDLESAGSLEGDAAKSLRDRVRDVRQELRKGEDPEKVLEAAEKVDEELRKGVEDGKISPEAQTQLQPLVDDLVTAARAYADGSD
ncbi:serine/threonine-protein kinase [Oryzobacter sp. R7]|uniref:serine/threonine-protein kinase n=1 Tax=Oryzobacter faecalis TaxID=3388656 RepID=UPI00398CD929